MYLPYDLEYINARRKELEAGAAEERLVRAASGPRQPTYFLGRLADRYRGVFERRRTTMNDAVAGTEPRAPTSRQGRPTREQPALFHGNKDGERDAATPSIEATPPNERDADPVPLADAVRRGGVAPLRCATC